MRYWRVYFAIKIGGSLLSRDLVDWSSKWWPLLKDGSIIIDVPVNTFSYRYNSVIDEH